MITKKQIRSEAVAIFEGAALHALPLYPFGMTRLILAPSLAGREAGIGAYKLERGGDPYRFVAVLDRASFEGHAARSSIRNAWNEVKGIARSCVPGLATIPTLSIMAGPDLNVTNTMAYGALLVHTVSSYLISRHHAKTQLAPQYAVTYDAQYNNG